MISKEYLDILEMQKTRDFILTNRRSPNEIERLILLREIKEQYYDVDEIGITGFDLETPSFLAESSVSIENKNREMIFTDLSVISNKIDELYSIETYGGKSLIGSILRGISIADALDDRLNNLLLLRGTDSAFLHGIEENFLNNEHIDIENSTCSILPNQVTLGKRNFEVIDLQKKEISFSLYTEKPYIKYLASNKPDTLKYQDGIIWSGTVSTNYLKGKVSLIINIDLKEKEDITNIIFKMLPVENNGEMFVNCYYSTNGSTYSPSSTVNLKAEPYMVLPINMNGVQKVQIVLTKDTADIKKDNNEYEYVYLIDQIEIHKEDFRTETNSSLVSKAYEINDSNGNPIHFTKAKFESCSTVPEGTGISFSISNDNQTWIPISNLQNQSEIILFGESAPLEAIAYIDETLSGYQAIDISTVIDDADYGNEVLLNQYINAQYANDVYYQNITIKRNTVPNEGQDSIYNAVSGWFFDQKTNMYYTTIFIQNSAGTFIDLGTTTAILNGKKVTGMTFFPAGYSEFKTNKINWNILEEDLISLDELKKQDKLYPYNHKYLIEGYPYAKYFKGEKIYNGVDHFFGLFMEYISNEEFELLDRNSDRFLKSFTIEETETEKYIKVKTHKQDPSWQQENFKIDFILKSKDSSSIFVKAELSSAFEKSTPVLLSYKVQVI